MIIGYDLFSSECKFETHPFYNEVWIRKSEWTNNDVFKNSVRTLEWYTTDPRMH